MSCSNGRVDVLKQTPPDIQKLFNLYDKIPAHQCSSYQEPTIGIWNESPLSQAYFSQNNIQIIQNAIRAGVYYKSNKQYIVAQQDCDAVKVIMRSIYLTHAANQSINLTQQIENLNKLVIEYCMEEVYKEAIGYKKYLRDVSSIADPIALPMFDSQMDKKELKLKPWF
jgi:hypothetical protein